MRVICAEKRATTAHLARAASFEAVGQCMPADEAYFNAVTALSGSGPANLYRIMEALGDAGVRVGLPRQMALGSPDRPRLGPNGSDERTPSRSPARRRH
jgi:pyrroline-5-carboxylate reductase